MEEKKGDMVSVSGGSDVETSIASEVSTSGRKAGDLKITIVLALHLAVLQQLSGINAIVVYGSKIA